MTTKRELEKLIVKLNTSDIPNSSFSEVTKESLVDFILKSYKDAFGMDPDDPGDHYIWWLTNDLLGIYAGTLHSLNKVSERKFWRKVGKALGEPKGRRITRQDVQTALKSTRELLEGLNKKDLFAIYGWRELKDKRTRPKGFKKLG